MESEPANLGIPVPAAGKSGTQARSTRLPNHRLFSLRLEGLWGLGGAPRRVAGHSFPPVGRRKGKYLGPGVIRVQLCLGRDYCCSLSMQPCDYEMNSKHLFPRCKPCSFASCFDPTSGERGGGKCPLELFL